MTIFHRFYELLNCNTLKQALVWIREKASVRKIYDSKFLRISQLGYDNTAKTISKLFSQVSEF